MLDIGGFTVPSEMVNGVDTPYLLTRVPGFKLYMDMDTKPGQVQYYQMIAGKRVDMQNGGSKTAPGAIVDVSGFYIMTPGIRPEVIPTHYRTAAENQAIINSIEGPFGIFIDTVKELAKKAVGAALFVPLRVFEPLMISQLAKKGVIVTKSAGTEKIAGLFFIHVIQNKNNLENLDGVSNEQLATAATQMAGAAAGASVGIPPQVSSAIIKMIIDFFKGGFKKSKGVPATIDEAKALGKNVLDNATNTALAGIVANPDASGGITTPPATDKPKGYLNPHNGFYYKHHMGKLFFWGKIS